MVTGMTASSDFFVTADVNAWSCGPIVRWADFVLLSTFVRRDARIVGEQMELAAAARDAEVCQRKRVSEINMFRSIEARFPRVNAFFLHSYNRNCGRLRYQKLACFFVKYSKLCVCSFEFR